MRNLSIKRTKSFVGCLVALKVYIEDPTAPETTIADTPCRKLGTIKNGEVQVFSIDDNAHKVFVIADSMSKNYCSDCYAVPAGTEDIFLSGKNKFNPGTGNAFLFDNNNSEEAQNLRKKNKKKGWVIWVCALIVGVIIGGAVGYLANRPSAPVPKTFRAQDLSITLTDAFRNENSESYSMAYGTKDVAVLGAREEYTGIPELAAYSVDQYASAMAELQTGNGKTLSEIKKENNLIYFTYDFRNEAKNQTFRYYTFFYKGSAAFWTVQIVVETKNAEARLPDIMKWAGSVAVQ